MGIIDAFAHIVKADVNIIKRAIYNSSDERDVCYNIMPESDSCELELVI